MWVGVGGKGEGARGSKRGKEGRVEKKKNFLAPVSIRVGFVCARGFFSGLFDFSLLLLIFFNWWIKIRNASCSCCYCSLCY